VLVSYGCNDYPNSTLLEKYGFVRPANPYDAMSWDDVPALAPRGEGQKENTIQTKQNQVEEGEGARLLGASDEMAPQEPPVVSLELLEEALKSEAVAAGLR
jgi:hypothetical protein